MALDAAPMADGFGRRFHYLRLSVTEVCNFSCTYCLPNGWKKTGPLSFLTVDEIRRLVAGFSELGLSKVRLTGGEPTVRTDFNDIIGAVQRTVAGMKLTNGFQAELIAAEPDLTLDDIRLRLSGVKKLKVGTSSIWRFYDRQEITFKKNSARRRAGSS